VASGGLARVTSQVSGSGAAAAHAAVFASSSKAATSAPGQGRKENVKRFTTVGPVCPAVPAHRLPAAQPHLEEAAAAASRGAASEEEGIAVQRWVYALAATG
jgi:hypothetical protein